METVGDGHGSKGALRSGRFGNSRVRLFPFAMQRLSKRNLVENKYWTAKNLNCQRVVRAD